MIYSHRAFWTEGHGAQGLDRGILTIRDGIEFDTGTIIPAFAPLTYGPSRVPYGPHREMTTAQAARVNERLADRRYPGRLCSVDADGVARVVCSCGHYAPIVYRVWPDGRSERVDSPYGDGERSYAALKREAVAA